MAKKDRKARSVELLNAAVADELAAVHQYMFFHFHLDDQGLGPLAMLFKQTAIGEMRHVEALAERILFLGGEVEMVASAEVQKLHDAEEIVKCAAGMEDGAVEMYNQSARECSENNDAGSKEIFEALIGDEEGHFDQFDTVIDNIRRFGPNYLALQTMGSAEPGAGSAGA
ncbi:MAG: Bacterioferritin [Phycisphaerae bacterium]|nr:Bacterioferritin [Phycisphaerae bacterium]